MAVNDLGVEVPAGSDTFDPQGDMVELADSLAGRIALPVANDSARNALAALLSPSTSEPLVVRYPSGLVQSTVDGTTWRNEAFPASTGTITTTANWTGNLVYSVAPGGTITITGEPVRVGNASATVAGVVASGGVPANLRPWSTIYGRAYASNGRSYHAVISTAGQITMVVNTISGDLTDGSTVQFSFPAYPIQSA